MSIPVLKIPIVGFIKQGDTIPKITVSLGDDFEDDLTSLHIVRMQVYDGNDAVINISSAPSGGITIIDANTFEIDEVVQNDLPIGTLKGDLQIEKYTEFGFDPINITTYFNVEYTIIKDYTKIP